MEVQLDEVDMEIKIMEVQDMVDTALLEQQVFIAIQLNYKQQTNANRPYRLSNM